jgi:hypothetical protein
MSSTRYFQLINTPNLRGGDTQPTETSVSRGDFATSITAITHHDVGGPRAPKAHLGTVLTKPVVPPAGHPSFTFSTSNYAH